MNLFTPVFNLTPWQETKLTEVGRVHDEIMYAGHSIRVVEFNEHDTDRVFDIFDQEDIQVEPRYGN